MAASGTVAYTLATRIDVSEFSELTAYVRFHDGTVVASEPTFAQIQWQICGYTEEDPAALSGSPPIIGFDPLTVVTGFANLKTIPPPTMKVTKIPTNFGSLLTVVMLVTASATGTLQYVMSIDLIGKNRDPGPDYVSGIDDHDPILSEVVD
jgi:hypothetical protein